MADNNEGTFLVGCNRGGKRQNWHIVGIKHVLVMRDGAVVVSVERAGQFRCGCAPGEGGWEYLLVLAQVV